MTINNSKAIKFALVKYEDTKKFIYETTTSGHSQVAFLIIWCFFIIRTTSVMNFEVNLLQFRAKGEWLYFLMDISSLFILFGFLLYLFIFFLKKKKISKSVILIIYPIIALMGYYFNGYINSYQDSIQTHHFVTLSVCFLYFTFLQSNKVFDYKFKELILKIILIFILVHFLLNILPAMYWNFSFQEDLIFTSERVLSIFGHKLTITQNINGQTKFIFILLVIAMLLFKKFLFNKRYVLSHLFYFISILLVTTIYLSQARFNILASFTFSFFLIINIKNLKFTNKIIYFSLILITPLIAYNLYNDVKVHNKHRLIKIEPIYYHDAEWLKKIDTDLVNKKIDLEVKKINLIKIIEEIIVKTAVPTVDTSLNAAVPTVDTSLNAAVPTVDTSLNAAVPTVDTSLNATVDTSLNAAVDTSLNAAVNVFQKKTYARLLIFFKGNFLDEELNIDFKHYVEGFQLAKIMKMNNVVNVGYKNYNTNEEKSLFSSEVTSNLYEILKDYKHTLIKKCSNNFKTIDQILTGRVCGWELLWDVIKAKELILGLGFFADQVFLKPLEKVSSNSFVNLLFNAGIITLLIYVIIIVIFLIKFFKIKNINHTKVYLSAAHYLVIYLLMRSLIEDTLAFVSIDFLLIGICLVLIRHYQEVKK
jgi:hypothetical protein